MKINRLSEESIFNEFFEVRKGILQFERFDGSMSAVVTRYSFCKWDAVAVLVYHRKEDVYILVQQMRYPPVHHAVDPWLTEIVAGGIIPGEDEEAAGIREVIEETGYRPLSMERINRFYVSPGIMSERITLFYAEVDESSRVNEGGGHPEEDEDIRLIRIPRSKGLEWMESLSVGDSKTIIALQWHALLIQQQQHRSSR